MTPCTFLRFCLIVTGKGEKEFLPQLFAPLRETGICTFKVCERIGQRGPITSPKREAHMAGKGQRIPTLDEERISFPVRRILQQEACTFVILIDDLENYWRDQAQEKFNRYREAVDALLEKQPELKQRASVHFLVNMLEAYYFADAAALNACLQLDLADFEGDVETLTHPKNQLKGLYKGFDEVEDGENIIGRLQIDHILADPQSCGALRTLFAWCIEILQDHYKFPEYLTLPIEGYHLQDGIYYNITSGQLQRYGKSPQ